MEESAFAALMGFFFGGILLVVLGYNPILAYYYMFYGAFGSLSNVTDMLGNAAEWTLDVYGPYPRVAHDENPTISSTAIATSTALARPSQRFVIH